MVRYAHLSRVEEGLQVGEHVTHGDVLGYVGNSGTSFAVNNQSYGGLHLHADILVHGELFWLYMPSAADVRRILTEVFEKVEDHE
jgi:murein DD-endopeptidase MepM/ murein hydrolase activator NlpD